MLPGRHWSAGYQGINGDTRDVPTRPSIRHHPKTWKVTNREQMHGGRRPVHRPPCLTTVFSPAGIGVTHVTSQKSAHRPSITLFITNLNEEVWYPATLVHCYSLLLVILDSPDSLVFVNRGNRSLFSSKVFIGLGNGGKISWNVLWIFRAMLVSKLNKRCASF